MVEASKPRRSMSAADCALLERIVREIGLRETRLRIIRLERRRRRLPPNVVPLDLARAERKARRLP